MCLILWLVNTTLYIALVFWSPADQSLDHPTNLSTKTSDYPFPPPTAICNLTVSDECLHIFARLQPQY